MSKEGVVVGYLAAGLGIAIFWGDWWMTLFWFVVSFMYLKRKKIL